jgi:hypothetical protein
VVIVKAVGVVILRERCDIARESIKNIMLMAQMIYKESLCGDVIYSFKSSCIDGRFTRAQSSSQEQSFVM